MHLNIKIAAIGDQPTFPEMAGPEGSLVGFSILEGGMVSGKTSTALHIELDDGLFVTAEVSAEMFLAMAAVLRGAMERFGDKPEK